MIFDSKENKKLIINYLIKNTILFDWTNEALNKSCIEAGIDEKYLPLIFENGIYSAIEDLTIIRCEELEEIANKNDDFKSLKLNKKISYLILNLLLIDLNNKESLKKLINFYINPKNIINSQSKSTYLAFYNLYKVSDFLWKLCEDKSTDLNFYSKRLILAKILSKVFIFFCNDESNDAVATANYIDDQIKLVLKFSAVKFKLKNKMDLALNNLKNIILDENNIFKDPKTFVKDLPFIRLITKNFKI